MLYGGRSGEHEISLISAQACLGQIDAERYEIIVVGMDRDGKCYLNDYQEMLTFRNALPVKTKNSTLLPSMLIDGKFFTDADVVLPMVHGPLYEDGCLQGMLDLADVAFVGSHTLASAISMDKDISRRLVCDTNIKSAPYLLCPRGISNLDIFCDEITATLKWPLFVKPCSMGSSVGISRVNNKKELQRAILDARHFDTEVIIEESIVGREIELAVLEDINNPLSPKVSLPGEIVVNHSDGFYSYAAKYVDSDATALVVPAQLNSNLTEKLQQIARDIFVRLKCRGMARIDFFVDDENELIYFNEANTLPGFTPISMYPRLWQYMGVPYPMLLDELVEIAIMHHKNRRMLVREYQ